MSGLFTNLLDGVSLGAVYAFIALGYTMVYGVIRLINFAHGEVFMVGAFAGYFTLRDSGIDRLPLPQPWPVVLSYAAALVAGALASGLVAVLAERFCYRPIRKAGRVAALLTAVGLSILLQNVARELPFIGPSARAYPSPRVFVDAASIPVPADASYYRETSFTSSTGAVTEEEATVVLAGGRLSDEERARLAAPGAPRPYRKAGLTPGAAKACVIAMLALAATAVWLLVKRTRMGRAMRAASEDLDAARLMGVDVDRVVVATFFLGALIAGAGGVAYSTAYGNVDPLTGFLPGLKAFVAAVLGGIGSIPGAVVGGLSLGLLETLFGAYVSTEWKDGLAFLALVAVLLVRPTGLLGVARREKV